METNRLFVIIISLLLISCGGNPNGYDPNMLTDSLQTNVTTLNTFKINFKKTDSNLKTVHIKLNDANGYDALFDTGCSGMLISSLELVNLIKSGTISESDYVGVANSVIADGTVIENAVYNIREVSFIDTDGTSHTIRDVQATVVDNPQAEILIGSAVIDNLCRKSYTVDLSNKLIIFQ